MEERFNGDAAAAAAAGLEGFGAGDMSAVAGSYMIVDWQDEKYVGLKNKTDKLVRLLLEQYFWGEHKLLFEGDSWDIGSGWTLTAQSIDKYASPRQALLVLSKNGIKKDEKVIFEKKIYTYVEKSLGGETNIPTFVTFVDSILPSETTDAVLLRYTWAIDTNVTTTSPEVAMPEPRETPAYATITATPKSTPGFEVVIAIVALGAISIIKKKRISE
ncbi:MAG TPA: S-layer protein domain-containing protein [Candidatus Methanoperedens sp.]